jgi:branched-chain amino acid transport system permease protein
VDPSSALIQVLNGLAFSMLLFLLAAGLTVIFGLMDFMNLAHGSFYMLGAYLAWSSVQPTATKPFGLGINFWLALAVAPLMLFAVGYVLERFVLGRMYRRGHLDQVLLTFGLALIAADLVRWAWGADIRSIPAPEELRGALDLGWFAYPRYRLFVTLAGVLVALLLWAGQQRTRLGAIVRAGVDDREMVSGLGIDIDRVSSLVFAGGAALAGLAGVIAGPFQSLQPGMDFSTLILSLVVVVVGGLGTLRGSFFAAVLVGLVDTFGKAIPAIADFSLLAIYVLMAVVLLVRPAGLFGRATA